MSNAYYSLQLSTQGASSSSAYFYVTVMGSTAQFDGAGISVYPSQAQTTYFSYQSQSVQFQAPAARLAGGITVVTPNQEVVGTMGVSPAINVDTVLSIYGTSALGSVTLKAGQTSVPFHFDLPNGSGLNPGDAQDVLAKVAGKPE
jgi:hypothetical protein